MIQQWIFGNIVGNINTCSRRNFNARGNRPSDDRGILLFTLNLPFSVPKPYSFQTARASITKLFFSIRNLPVPSFPLRRESMLEFQELFFKSGVLKFYDGFPPARE